MEMEFQLLDVETLDLVDGILPLMRLFPDDPYIKPEFNQNTVEVCSKICNNINQLEENMRLLVNNLHSTCQQLDMRLCGAGTHPFGERLAIITPMPRYRQLENSTRYLGYTQITFATHVHLGMTSGDEAIFLMRELKAFLPLLIAISASSPFWRGFDTGYAAYRHRILSATRSYGIPPSFNAWEDFSGFLETTHRAGVFETINDIHWDIRPRPHLGSLEIRVMDAQHNITMAVNLAAFVRALVTYLSNTPVSRRPKLFPRGLHWWIEKHNHFQASQLGLDAQYILDTKGTLAPLRELFHQAMEAIGPVAVELDQSACFKGLELQVKNGPAYALQRKVYEKTGSFRAVVENLVAELEGNLRQTI